MFRNRSRGTGRIGPIHTHLNAERVQLEVAYTMSMKALVAVLLLPVAFLSEEGGRSTMTLDNHRLIVTAISAVVLSAAAPSRFPSEQGDYPRTPSPESP